MLPNPSIDDVLAVASGTPAAFVDLPRAPVPIADPEALEPDEAAALVTRYEAHGFAVAQLRDRVAGPEPLEALADALGLGEAFVPPLYTSGGRTAPGISRISVATGHAADAVHPSFERAVGLPLHVDGTLQEIGVVKVSALLCEMPATEGGETILFDAAGAYGALARDDRAAAAALAADGVLVRQANIHGCADSRSGPAFALRDGRLACAYSVAETDRWEASWAVEPSDLARGLAVLEAAARAGSPYHAQIALGAGQVVLLDNTRLSHGRTPYRDAPRTRRMLYRGLYLRHPSAPRGEAGMRKGGGSHA